MRLVDANVLLYAVDSSAEHHEASSRWLQVALDGGDLVGFTWVAAIAFLRLSTSRRLLERPLDIAESADQLETWTSSPAARWVAPTPGSLFGIKRLLIDTGTAGNLVNDAHIAALAVEHRASIATYDRDFDRFTGIAWATPDELLRETH